MKNLIILQRLGGWLLACMSSWPALVSGQEAPQFNSYQILTNRELVLQLSVPKGRSSRIDVSANLRDWSPLVALPVSSGSLVHTDSAAALLDARFYRAT